METDEIPSNAGGILAENAIKKEDWRLQTLRATATEFQHLAVKIEPLQPPQEIESAHTAPVALIPQTHECLKKELMLDDESPDATSHSRGHNLEIANDQQARISTAEKRGKTFERRLRSDPEVVTETQQKLPHRRRRPQCVVCSRSFRNSLYLRNHMATHDKDRRREFVCESCGRAFYHKRNMLDHMKTHFNNTHNCKVCGKHYTQNHNLKRHMLREHSKDNHQYSSGPLNSNDAYVETNAEFISNGKILDEDKGSDSAEARRKRNHTLEVEQRAPDTIARAQTPNSASIHPKTELMSDEEFLDEANVEEPAQGSQQGTNISMPEDRVGGEFCHNMYPKEFFSKKCDLCPKTFRRSGYLNLQMSLNNHRRIHDSRTYACRVCGAACENPRSRKDHMLREHPSESPNAKDRKAVFSCRMCGKTFPTRSSLVDHRADVHTSRNYKFCQICGAAFKNDTSRKEHIVRLHPSQVQQFFQKPQTANADDAQIKTELASEEEFYEEDVGAASVQGDSVSCEICHNLYSKELFSAHMRVAHCEKPHKCELCPKSYTRMKNLRQHMRTHAKDGEEEKTYKCEICPKSFTALNILKRHTRTHAKDRKADFACRICGKTFTAASTLQDHRTKVHTGQRYECQVCGAAFRYSKSRKQHMQRKHFQEVPENHTANADSMQTATRSTSDKAFLEVDGGTKSARRSPQNTRDGLPEHSVTKHCNEPFKCNLCPRSFRFQGWLEQHMVTHVEDRKEIECRTCGKTFSNSFGLSNHRRIHDSTRYECQVCGATFKNDGNRREHMYNQHPGEAQQFLSSKVIAPNQPSRMPAFSGQGTA